MAQPETLAVFVVTGDDDFVVEVSAANVPGLRDFVLDHITSRRHVLDNRTSLVYECSRKYAIEKLKTDLPEHPVLAPSSARGKPRPKGSK